MRAPQGAPLRCFCEPSQIVTGSVGPSQDVIIDGFIVSHFEWDLWLRQFAELTEI